MVKGYFIYIISRQLGGFMFCTYTNPIAFFVSKNKEFKPDTPVTDYIELRTKLGGNSERLSTSGQHISIKEISVGNPNIQGTHDLKPLVYGRQKVVNFVY